MNKGLSRLAAWCAQELIWGGELLGAENLPCSGPAVFVCNHLGALGPIAAFASIPFRLHFWIHADMLDPVLAPDYLRRDFVERQLHLSPPFSRWLAQCIAKIHVPLLRAIGGIPVYHTSEGLLQTFDQSLNLLEKGACLLIFPEDADRPVDEQYQMQPFKKGFARLGELYYARTGECLAFYPVAVHARSLTVRVGKPVRYIPWNDPTKERARIKSNLEYFIRQMYRQAELKDFAHIPLPN